MNLNTVNMWPQMVIPHQNNMMFSHHNREGLKQPYRNFGMIVSPMHVIQNKSFSGFKKPSLDSNCQAQVDKSTGSNTTNSCQKPLIESIKEQCPKLLSCTETNPTDNSSDMCLNNPTVRQQRKRASKTKKSIASKKTKAKRDLMELTQDLNTLDQSLDTSFVTDNKPLDKLTLYDFISKNNSHKTENTLYTPKMKGPEPLDTLSNRTRTMSATDSEDSFIIFDHDGNEESLHTSKESECDQSPKSRARLPSVCESEDSFIMFERDDVEEDSDEDDDTSQSEEGSEDEEDSDDGSSLRNMHLEENSDCDEVDSSYSIIDHKKVRFAAPEKLCEIHPMVKWSFAYQAARKGPWEMYARDRSRFMDRALRVERDIKHIFDPKHRAKIYKQRFKKID